MLSLRPHSYINTASVLQSTTKANMTQSLKTHVSHKYISVHPSLTAMWYYNDTSCTVLPDGLFSQLNHTATHFCLHFPVVTITAQIADWVSINNPNSNANSFRYCITMLVPIWRIKHKTSCRILVEQYSSTLHTVQTLPSVITKCSRKSKNIYEQTSWITPS